MSTVSTSRPLTVVEPDTLQKLDREQCGICYHFSTEVRLECSHMKQHRTTVVRCYHLLRLLRFPAGACKKQRIPERVRLVPVLPP